MRHDKVIEFTKEMDKIVKSLPENQATVTSKLMQNWITGLSYLHNVEGPAGPMINARVDSRDGFVQIKTMLDENSKLLEKALKTTREANAEADKAAKDSENFMRNNKNLLKKYAPWKEYYTEGMTDMDTIIYKDDPPENDGEITTESANEAPTLDELDAYIEYAMSDLHDAMELRNRLIQESDDVDTSDIGDDGIDSPDTVQEADWWNDDEREIFRRRMHLSRKKKSQSGLSEEDKKEYEANAPKYFDLMKRTQERASQSRPVKESYVLDGSAEYYSDAIIRNYNEPIQENKTYCLKTNDMFTTESYDDTTPNRFVQEMVPDKYIAMSLDTAFTIRAAAKVFVICKAVESICDSLIYNKILGRFPSEMKRVMDIIKESKDGTINTKTLRMALSDLKHEAKTVSGYNVISFKAKRNFTQTEREELRKLINITSDLEHMLTDKPDKAASRRVSARIEDFVKQSETVMKLINRGKNPGDVVKEYMS
jgi:hypothetical protein